MSVSVLYMSMSLDGYIADQGDRLGGDDGNRLHDWFVFTSDGEFRADGPAAAGALHVSRTIGMAVTGRCARWSLRCLGDVHSSATEDTVPPATHSVRRRPDAVCGGDRRARADTDSVVSPVVGASSRRLTSAGRHRWQSVVSTFC